jgi:hypothetical protein
MMEFASTVEFVVQGGSQLLLALLRERAIAPDPLVVVLFVSVHVHVGMLRVHLVRGCAASSCLIFCSCRVGRYDSRLTMPRKCG